MASIVVQKACQIDREALELSQCEEIPRVKLVDGPDPHRSLRVVVPLDPTHATWVEFEQTPLFINTTRTKFTIRPPFDAKQPPRFVLYFPHENKKPIDRHLFLSVVDGNKPFDYDKTSIWSVFPLAASPSSVPIARGLILRRSDAALTILDVERNTEVKILSKKIRLERESPFRPGVGAKVTLFGQSESSIPSPVGTRYGLRNCLSARLTYLFDLQRQKDEDDDIPSYACTIQHQFLIKNESSVKFSRVSSVSIASETFFYSEDGYPTRAFTMSSPDVQPVQLIRPLYTLHETKTTIPARGNLIITDHAAAIQRAFAVVTIGEPPVRVGEYAATSVDVWLPTADVYKAAPQPGVAQLHVTGGIPGFDDINAVTPWQRSDDQADIAIPWTRIGFFNSATKISAQCIVRQSQPNIDYVSITVVNYFARPMLLAFVIQPGAIGACSNIEAVAGARAIDNYPWLSSVRGATYKVFVVGAFKEPIAFRGTIVTAK